MLRGWSKLGHVRIRGAYSVPNLFQRTPSSPPPLEDNTPKVDRSPEYASRAVLATKYEKIQINVPNFGHQDSFNMLMNRNVSTSLDVAAHISKSVYDNAALAAIIAPHQQTPQDTYEKNIYHSSGDDSEHHEAIEFIDMREALTRDCKIQILTHKIHTDAPYEFFVEVNKAYWRTCSFFLAFCLKRSFSDSVTISNMKILNLSVNDGCFGVEFDISDEESKTADWVPSELDLTNFTKTARNYLTRQPEFIMAGKHAYSLDGDMAEFDGPLVHSLDLIGPFAVTSCTRTGDHSFMVNGVSMPKEFATNHALFGLLEQRARSSNILNRSPILSNQSKRHNFTYKQWTDAYVVQSDTQVDLTDRHEEIAATEQAKLDHMQPDITHELNVQHREYEVGRKRMKPQIRMNEAQKFKMKSIFTGGKFQKSVYIDHEQQ